MSAITYRPDIDGLRAIAVIAVIVFHAGLGCPGGYVGVDVFFVISGFLITSIIRRRQQQERFTLRDFWHRRIRRIVPPALLMVAVTLIVGTWLLLPRDLVNLGRSAIAHQLLASNIHFWRKVDYFATASELKPLLHTWSLAVEEQFYLLYPLLLVWLARRSTRIAVMTLSGLTLASFAFSAWSVTHAPAASYFLLPSRAWEMLVGGLLAYVPLRTGPRLSALRQISGLGGLALIIGCALLYEKSTSFPGWMAVPVCLGTLLVLDAGSDERNLIRRVLAWRPLVAVGLLSYSLYLWHWPVLALLRYRFGLELPLLLKCAALALTVGCAWLSYLLLETPIRTGRRLSTPKRLVLSTTAAGSLLVICCGVVLVFRGLPQRLSPRAAALLETACFPWDHQVAYTGRLELTDLPRLGSDDGSDRPVDFIVWGDSHAMVLGRMLDDLAKQHGVRGVLAAKPGIPPLCKTWSWRGDDAREVVAWNDDVVDCIKRHRIKHVILPARWALYAQGEHGDSSRLLVRNTHQTPTPESAQKDMHAAIGETIAMLQEHGCRVWLMKQVPLQADDPVRRVVFTAADSSDGAALPGGVDRTTHTRRQAAADRVLESFAHQVRILDPTPNCFGADGRSRVSGSGAMFYCDRDHLSESGANSLIRPLFEPVFASMRLRTAPTQRVPVRQASASRVPSRE